MGVWRVFFGWPVGGVWANLISSLICLAVGFVAGRRAIRGLHAKLAAHHQVQLTLIRQHHAAQLAAISALSMEEDWPT